MRMRVGFSVPVMKTVIGIFSIVLLFIIIDMTVSGVTEASTGACWRVAQESFTDFSSKDGSKNPIILGDCVKKAFIVRRESNDDELIYSYHPDFCGEKFKDESYNTFYFVYPAKTSADVDFNKLDRYLGEEVRNYLRKSFCGARKFKMTEDERVIELDGNRDYCITVTDNRQGKKDLHVLPGECQKG